MLLYIRKTHTDGTHLSFSPGSPIHTIALQALPSSSALPRIFHFLFSCPCLSLGQPCSMPCPMQPWASSPLPAPCTLLDPLPSIIVYKHPDNNPDAHPHCPACVETLRQMEEWGSLTPGTLSVPLWGWGQHLCQGNVNWPRQDSTTAPLGPLPFPRHQDEPEEVEDDSAQNTHTWG